MDSNFVCKSFKQIHLDLILDIVKSVFTLIT